jgi:endonuclease/exonuclease/phosphatase family metal-dependent hydrolase
VSTGDAVGHAGGVLALATFNTHLGVDGWGRPFDVVAVCRSLDADVLVLQESWAPDGEPSLARRVGDALGYEVVEEVLGRGRLLDPDPAADGRWGPSLGLLSGILHVDDDPRWRQRRSGARRSGGRHGTWGVALLVRVPVRFLDVTRLTPLRRDPVRRVVLSCEVPMGDGVLTVHGTHFSHLLHGSPRHYREAFRRLASGGGPAVLAGDMNLWGPAVSLLLPGWRRVVHGRTWPATRPHSQLDHVLVTGPVTGSGAVLGPVGSDHRPVRVVLAVDDREPGASAAVPGDAPRAREPGERRPRPGDPADETPRR